MAVLALILVSVQGQAQNSFDYQNTPVTVSKEKVKVDGKIYYTHKVLERQTVFSICKAYGVTDQELYDANPNLKVEGLKTGRLLLVPVTDRPAEDKIKVRQVVKITEPPKSEPAPVQVQAPEVEAQAPILAPEVEVASPVETPEVEAQAPVEEEKVEISYPRQKFRQHTVKWYEDIYSIAEKYSFNAEDLIRINQLESHRLTPRQKLWIPKNSSIVDEYLALLTQTVQEPVEAEQTQEASDSTTVEIPVVAERQDTVNIAIMLPLNSTGNISGGNMDFYSGALLAARELGNTGINVQMNVYDINDQAFQPDSSAFINADIVIGPVSVPEINRTLSYNTDNTMLVSPLDPKAESLAYTDPRVIHAPASAMTQYEDLINWMVENSAPGDSILVLYEKGSNEMVKGSPIRTMLENTGLKLATFCYNILEGREITDSLKTMTSLHRENKVLVVSERQAFVNDAVRNLNVLIHEKYNVVLYAPSKIRSYETIEIDNLHNTRLHCTMSYYVDYDSKDVKKFLMTYRALYKTEPSPFAYQGYDLTYCFVKAIAENGQAWKQKLSEQKVRLLQSDFKFQKASAEGGYINKGIRRLKYLPEYQIKFLD